MGIYFLFTEISLNTIIIHNLYVKSNFMNREDINQNLNTKNI